MVTSSSSSCGVAATEVTDSGEGFQSGGNTYVLEAINSTGSPAVHGSLAATDEIIKIIGLVNLAGESLSAHRLTL